MSISLKAAPALLGALALAFVAGIVQAANPAYRTSKNGWSTEHSCERDGETKQCWTMTRGKAVLNPSDADAGASLIYGCTSRNEEWLYFSMFSTHSPKRDITTMKVRWGRERTETIRTEVTKRNRRGKSLYNYEIKDSERASRQLTNRLRRARLRHAACIEDIDFRQPRGLDRDLVLSLADGRWVRDHLNVLITGPPDPGS